MQETKKEQTKRVRKLAILFALTAIILSVSTYAWFIGMRTVHVSSFDVEIAAVDSLMLSLNGETWHNTVKINEDTFDQVFNNGDSGEDKVYEGHTNWWTGGKGLIPMSSVGVINDTSSRLELYEKASLTATSGGYRLMSSLVDNTSATEKEGYVAFDLFVRNYTGTQYITDLNQADEEAIYMTFDSAVGVASSGVPGTGLENSVRVAFAEIGRVEGLNSPVNLIKSIDCNKTGATNGITGICGKDGRKTAIWEPNDAFHVAGALDWYNTSCRERTVDAGDSTYGAAGSCSQLEENQWYPTYAVADAIASEDNVDVYDGAEYNKYTGTSEELLNPVATFRDTNKDKRGVERPELITLAPNSITKIRVYIWIEGQDIDNYDFASIGKAISVKFGFTKERFEEQDIGTTGYNGPEYRPVISFSPTDETINVQQNDNFVEPTVTATDAYDGTTYTGFGDGSTNISRAVMRGNQNVADIDTSVPGDYTITYRATNSLGITGIKVLKVKVTPTP